MTDIIELHELLNKIKQSYLHSDIRKVNPSLSYSISSTRLTKNAPLIVGFNWGSGEEKYYSPQNEIPKNSFFEISPSDLGSMVRIIPYLKKYLSKKELEEIGQTNFCFFRSYKEFQISKYDLDLCSEIFIDLLKIVKPSFILSFTSKLRDFMLNKSMLIDIQEKSFPFRRGTIVSHYRTIKARLKATGSIIYFLPHQNYRLPSDLRNDCWDFCFNNQRNK